MTKTITTLAVFAALSTSSAFAGLSDHINLGAVLQPSQTVDAKKSGPPAKRFSASRNYRNDTAPAIVDNTVDNATSGVVSFFQNINLGAIAQNDTEAPQANNFRYPRSGRI
ncbi:MAG: hypothetical protein ACFB20_00330 [Opitutales bacterium]